jgi:hypothetical protein
MPHAELRYSSDLSLDPAHVLDRIEQVLQRHDPGSGECKGRAYPAEIFRHSHCLVSVSLLAKPHRNSSFIAALTEDIEREVKACIPEPCYFSLDISFSSQLYVTNRHEGAG